MSGHPTTGTSGTYEDGDEHNYSHRAIHDEQRHHLHNVEGYKPTKMCDELETVSRTAFVNRVFQTQAQIEERYKTDPLYRATMHGNKPSRGAQQDAEIQAEEAEMIRKKKEKTDSMAGKKLEHKSAREQD
ncbi:hypothetical protein FHL15_005935 [Xylaria flabelliformis]|uniref:Uncharacterized protein n=1 Tax=Xylaria flabelliformis TaxID=2512241 RepID=A0A553HYN7_9PEZI|nr:hypothetical protein FHL15_005935 [Xylaria flabelliformis]